MEAVNYFNSIARPDDIAAIVPSALRAIPDITKGRKMAVFASWAQAEQQLPDLAGQIDLVAYDSEHWANTPAAEQNNLVQVIQQAAEMAHSHQLEFVWIPDRSYAQQYIQQAAPYVDMIGLQAQKLQADPQAFKNWVEEMITLAKAANPQVKILVQVGATQGPADQMLSALQTVESDIDVIGIWTLPRTFGEVQNLVALVRQPNEPAQISPSPTELSKPSAGPTGAPATVSPSTTSQPVTPTTSPPPLPDSGGPAGRGGRPGLWILLILVLVAILVIILLLVGAFWLGRHSR
jgi:hypothetical protein